MKENNYLYQKIRQIDHDQLRPRFHFTAPVGWINDPNGLIFYKNYYHLFYQYYPYEPRWNDMHWGHARSVDGIHWEDLPIAMKPDHYYDKNGIFSGSAIEKDGKIYVIYTGHSVDENGDITESQCLAFSDNSIDFEKYENNPVITANDVPLQIDKKDFRDPKVFEHDGKYYCVIATAINNKGNLLLFESEDLIKWKYKSNLLPNENLGVMTECPDFFRVSGQDYLAFSVIWGEGKNNKVYIAKGVMDWQTYQFDLDKIDRLDDSDDFYASQSFLDSKNRRIIIPWLRSVDHVSYLEKDMHLWNGMMGIPREVNSSNGKLIQRPLGEIKDLDPTETEKINLGMYQLTKEIPIGRKIILSGKNGNIRIFRKEQNYYKIKIESQAFIKEYEWSVANHKLILVIDNSSLELFAKDKTLSIVTFVSDINQINFK